MTIRKQPLSPGPSPRGRGETPSGTLEAARSFREALA